MTSQERALRAARSSSLFYVVTGALLWLASIPFILSHSLRWAGALQFVVGLLFIMRWQMLSGPKLARVPMIYVPRTRSEFSRVR